MFSSRSLLKQYKSSQNTGKRRFPWWAILLASIILLVLVVWGIARLSGWNKLTIHSVTVVGATVVSVDEVKDVATQATLGTYVHLFFKNNILLYPRKQIERDILTRFPRIAQVSVSLVDTYTLSITVVEREPFALWCDTPPDFSMPDVVPNCYFLDYDGFVFAHSPQFSGDAYFKYYGILPYESPIGSLYLASTTRFHKLAEFVTTAKQLEISPRYILAQSQENFELYLFGGGKIIFDTSEGISKTADRLNVLLKTPHLIPRTGSILNVQYIDMRFGNRLFYKLIEKK